MAGIFFYVDKKELATRSGIANQNSNTSWQSITLE